MLQGTLLPAISERKKDPTEVTRWGKPQIAEVIRKNEETITKAKKAMMEMAQKIKEDMEEI